MRRSLLPGIWEAGTWLSTYVLSQEAHDDRAESLGRRQLHETAAGGRTDCFIWQKEKYRLTVCTQVLGKYVSF